MIRILFLIFFSINTFATLSFVEAEDIKTTSNSMAEKIYSPTECYTVVKVLGEGVFGKVYAVKDSLGNPFALKSHKMYEQTTDNHSVFFNLLASAQREFERGQLFDHPNIVKSYEIFDTSSLEEETTTNILLEYVEGNTLSKTEKKSLSKDEVLNAAVQFLDAVRYALTFEMFHLDLHHGNIMLDNNSNIKIIDLASFFNLKEILSFVKLESEKNKANSNEPQAMAMLAPNALNELNLDPVKEAKLRAFLDKHPRMVKKLETILEEKRKRPQAFKMMAQNVTDKEKETDKEESESTDFAPLHSSYFESVSEIVGDLVNKSNLPRQDKIELRAEIKKLAWNYQEDVEEGQKIPISTYLNLLVETLSSR